MKKFGTPIAAAPGVASESVGLLGAGVPFERVRGRVGTVGVFGAVTLWSPSATCSL